MASSAQLEDQKTTSLAATVLGLMRFDSHQILPDVVKFSRE